MHDPYFEQTCADIRGFDLGDDAAIVTVLDTRAAPSNDERLLRAVLRARAGRWAEASEDFVHVAEAGHARSLSLYLASHCQAEVGDLEAATELLAWATGAATEDGLVPEADLAHGRGRLLWLRGATQPALDAVIEGLRADDGEARRWVDRGVLAAAVGDDDDASAAFERALELEGDLAEALYESAVLASRRSPDARAVARWHAAFAVAPELRARAGEDVRLAQARDTPALAPVLGAPPAPDLRWLESSPPWLRGLVRAPPMVERGVKWLGADERRAYASGVRAAFERSPTGTMFTPATLAHVRARLAGMVPVAHVPVRPSREGIDEPAALWLDEASPDRLWLAWSALMPAFAWVDAGAEPHTVAAAIDPLTGGRPQRADLPRTHRAFIGYAGQLVVPHPVTGELEPAGVAQLEQHLSLSPYLESGAWGSAFADDPWPDVLPPQPGLTAKIEQHQTRVAAQSEAHVWSMTRRLRHSRGHFTIEVHHDDAIVLEIRYAPNPWPHVTEALDAALGCEYPSDLPLDAIAAVLGLVFDAASDLEPMLPKLAAEGDVEQLAGLLYVLSALRHSELDAHAIWRHYAEHPSDLVRATVADIALAYNFESLLEERTVLETDRDLREQIERALDEGLRPPRWDPYATTEEG